MKRKVALVIVSLLAATSCYAGFDFDGAGHADLVWFSPQGSQWSFVSPAASPVVETPPASSGYLSPVAGDYDGDGRFEPAVVSWTGTAWNPTWVTHGGAGTITFAAPPPPPGYETSNLYHVEPAPAKYDDGKKTLPAWYRDFDGMWFIQGHDPIQFGTGPTQPSPTGSNLSNASIDQDMPVPADYDGDGRVDLAVYNPLTGRWRMRSSYTGAITTTTLGGPGWLPVPANYDGVHHAQVAVFAFAGTSRGTWRIEGHPDVVLPPAGTDMLPVPADYDGDGKDDLGYFTDWARSGGTPTWHVPGRPDTVVATTGDVYPAETPAAIVNDLARLTLIYRLACVPSGPPATC